jgi:hypothetical protein
MHRGIDLDEKQVGNLLGRLADAADAPTPKELHGMAAVAVSSTSPARGLRRTGVRRSRSRLVVAMAAALLMLGTGATAYVLTDDPSPPRGLEAAVTLLFPRGHCVGADEATSLIQEKLAGLGLSDWSVAATAGASGERCVVAGLDPTNHQVILVPVERPDVVNAMSAVRDRLMAECLNEDQARDLIGSVLSGLRVTNWSIRTDGPMAYPIGQGYAAQAHIAEGCTVMTSSGHDADGSPVFYISPS